MIKTSTLVLILFNFSAHAIKIAETPADTVERKLNTKRLYTRYTARLHSSGFFYFGGKLAEYNPAFDVQFITESKMFGYSFLKAADLADIHSSFNFALAGIFRNVPVGEKLKFTPQLIFVLEQPRKIVDEGSDFGCTLTSAFKLNQFLTIEETIIFFNLVLETSHMDMINRARLLYSRKHLDVIIMGWHNNRIMDHEKHATAAVSVAYNRIRVSKDLLLGTSIMGSTTFSSSNQERVPHRTGLTFSLIATAQYN